MPKPLGGLVPGDGKTEVAIKQKTDIFGNIVFENDRGQLLNVYKTDISGNIIIEDGNGKVIGKQKNNIFGDTVVEDEHGMYWLNIKKMYLVIQL
ncbi:hypothetical protein [Pedobacter sp. R-06]|uniref:hypothetical protein n=1 Tax=Pedobacter sp. R-06 TaxID=3404051 RepID=UPI003CFAD98E